MANTRLKFAWRKGVAGTGLFVGRQRQIIDKLRYQQELFGHQRYLGQLDIGGMPFAKEAYMFELLATQVATAVRRVTAATAASASAAQ